MPLTLPLYGVIFAENPESEVARNIKALSYLRPERVRILVEDIERELTERTQPLDMTLPNPYEGIPGRDAALRRFLRQSVDELRRRGVPGANDNREQGTS
jgi:hypothetical protein